jgi:hypothetical protein
VIKINKFEKIFEGTTVKIKKGTVTNLSIVISIIVLFVSCINLALNYPSPHLEVGAFPQKSDSWSNTIGMVPINGTNPTRYNVTNDMSTQHEDYNFTYQVYNSGKAMAKNVNVSITGEPSEFKVNSTYVYAGAPLASNLLDVVKDKYDIGILGAGQSYTFKFLVQVSEPSGNGNFTITVDSENAGKQVNILNLVR